MVCQTLDTLIRYAQMVETFQYVSACFVLYLSLCKEESLVPILVITIIDHSKETLQAHRAGTVVVFSHWAVQCKSTHSYYHVWGWLGFD